MKQKCGLFKNFPAFYSRLNINQLISFDLFIILLKIFDVIEIIETQYFSFLYNKNGRHILTSTVYIIAHKFLCGSECKPQTHFP